MVINETIYELTETNDLQVKLERKRKVASKKNNDPFRMFDNLLDALQQEYDSKQIGPSFEDALNKLEDAFSVVVDYVAKD